jgi:hypothetical protein
VLKRIVSNLLTQICNTHRKNDIQHCKGLVTRGFPSFLNVTGEISADKVDKETGKAYPCCPKHRHRHYNVDNGLKNSNFWNLTTTSSAGPRSHPSRYYKGKQMRMWSIDGRMEMEENAAYRVSPLSRGLVL